jgi:hypothetical protein
MRPALSRRGLLGTLFAGLRAVRARAQPDAPLGAEVTLPPGVTPAPPGRRVVGVDYTLWHYQGNWPAWMKVWGTPALGYYESTNRAVMRTHAQWLADAGVDFILLDWSNQIGADDRTRRGVPWQLYIEDVTQALFQEYARLPARPKIAMLVGTPNATPALFDGRLQAKVDQVHAEYVANPAYRGLYMEHAGKPLLVVYLDTPSPFQHGLPPWTDPRFTVRFMTSFVSQQPALLGPGRVSRYGYWSWEDRGPPTFPIHDGHPEVMTLVAAWREEIGTIPPRGRRGGQTFREEWALARRLGPEIALVATFNEWRRGEQPSAEVSKDIEPSKEFGRLYLDILTEQAKLFKAGR